MSKNPSDKSHLFQHASQALIAGVVGAFAFGTAAAKAEVIIDVDMTTQTMHVASSSGEHL